jgi:apolipoprotein N-acyltransferase
MRKVPGRLWWAAALSALLQLLPFPLAGPVPLWRRLFCWFCLTPLLLALLGRQRDGTALKPSQTAWLGYLCGFLWYFGNCYWIYQTMYLYGGLPKPVAVGILILFSLYVGLYHALFGWLFGVLRTKFDGLVALLLSPLLWVGVELARARITGFPWDLLGYSLVDNHFLVRIVPWTGVMGLSLVVAGVNALWLARWTVRRRGVAVAAYGVAACLAVVILVAQRLDLPQAEKTEETAVLLQDNLSVGAERVHEGRDQLLASFDGLSEHPGQGELGSRPPNLVVWPEAPADFIDADPAYRGNLGQLALQMDAPVIADAIGVKPAKAAGEPLQEFNSASFVASDGRYAGRYDKMHLVPFGEYTPYRQLFFFAGHLLDQVGGFTAGTERTLFMTGGHRYGVFICYESIFGDEIRELALTGADVLVNVSDDGWYGDTSAPWEHLDMVRMRAIENHRWILRATNTGVTTAIDPEGVVGASLPRHVRSSLAVGFNYEDGTTFYTRHGDWLGWMCAAVTAIALAFGFSKAGRRKAVR